MNETQFLMMLENNKDLIIKKWMDDFLQNSLKTYDQPRLWQQAYSYFHFMLSLDIPFEQDDHVKNAIPYYRILIEHNISSNDILLSNQIWKDSVMLFVEEKLNGQLIAIKVLRKIHQRLDQYERHIFKFYNEYTNQLIEHKESTITELHEDRMAIIGKIASSMAHEIRNPLTSVLGFIKMMRKQISDRSFDKLSMYLDIVEVEFQKMQMQITGFLSFSKKNGIEESFVEVSLCELIETVVSFIEPRLIDENIELTLGEIQDVSLQIQKIAVQQVLSNILINSIDALYQKEGGREINVFGKREGVSYQFSISNNGPEIPPMIKDSVFAPFVTSKKEGTGLGLAISKQIMNRNNGDINFTSTPKETTFTMSFNIYGN